MKFSLIYADPAWTYEDKALAGNRGAGCKYQLLDDEGIYSLPISEIAEENSALALWVTMPKLAEGLECIRRWGFVYKTCLFTWVKPNGPFAAVLTWLQENPDMTTWGDGWVDFGMLLRKVNKHWAIGMGRHTRANAELVLLGVRGEGISRQDAGVNQIICAPAMKHSAKPPETRDRLVRLYGEVSRVELFARENAKGWVSLGNEIDGRDLRDSIPDLARMSGARLRLMQSRQQTPNAQLSRLPAA